MHISLTRLMRSVGARYEHRAGPGGKRYLGSDLLVRDLPDFETVVLCERAGQ